MELNRRQFVAASGAAALLFAVGCGDGDDSGSGGTQTEGGDEGGGGGGNTVTIRDFRFEPENLTVPAGTEVTWVNEDSAAHTATGQDQVEFDSGEMAQGDTFSFTFDQPGEVDYICTIHTYMQAKITVE